MPALQSTAFYATFLVSWFGAAGLTTALILSPVWGWFADPSRYLLAWALYGAKRVLLPLREWRAFKAACAFAARDAKDGGYFEEYDIVFADGVEQADLASSRKRLFGFHPHGMLLCGWTMAIADARTTAWDAAWLATRWVTVMPLVSEWMVWLGVQAVEGANFKRILASGKNICMAVGGYEEATHYEYGKYRVFLRGRGGFVKYCLKHGYAIHPVFTFGEERTYRSVAAGLKWRLLLNRIALPGVIFVGRWWCPFLPLPDAKLHTVVGAPIPDFPHIPDPTREDTAKWLAAYEKHLVALFDAHKARYAAAGDRAVLEVI